jgi:predicted kinase
MASLSFICGPVAAGKSTYARQLAQEKHALRGGRGYLLDLTAASLQNHVSVVLDWGFWKHQDRRDLIARFSRSQCAIELIYLKTPAELRWKRLELRNQNPGDGNHEIEEKDFAFFNSLFEEPHADDYPGVSFHLIKV